MSVQITARVHHVVSRFVPVGVFVSLGGHKDGTGQVSTSLLSKIVREFQLTVDIDAIVRDADADNSG